MTVGKETTDVVAVGVVITDVLSAGMVKDMIEGQEGAVMDTIDYVVSMVQSGGSTAIHEANLVSILPCPMGER